MAFNYNKAAATAKRLIDNFGSTTGEVRNYESIFDDIAGTSVEVYASTIASLVTVPSVDSLIRFDDQFVTALATGKARVFLIAASSVTFAPENGNVIISQNETWEIGSGGGSGGVMPLNPAGTPIIYVCGCVKSGRPMATPDSEIGDIAELQFISDAFDILMNTTIPASDY